MPFEYQFIINKDENYKKKHFCESFIKKLDKSLTLE